MFSLRVTHLLARWHSPRAYRIVAERILHAFGRFSRLMQPEQKEMSAYV